MADASTGWSSRNEIVSAVFRRSHPAVYGLIRQKKEQIMEELIIPALKISLLTTLVNDNYKVTSATITLTG